LSVYACVEIRFEEWSVTPVAWAVGQINWRVTSTPRRSDGALAMASL
jgi:hypothetical protein